MKPRFLIDENLPEDLSDGLGVPCLHAAALGDRLTDDALWQHAREAGCAILTKDADFFDKLAIYGPPPKVVWVRTGNMRHAELIEFLSRQWSRIQILLDQADLVEVHGDRIEAIKF